MKKHLQIGLSLLLGLLLSSCAHLHQTDQSCYLVPLAQRQQQRRAFSHWLVRGNLRLHTADQKSHATLVWQQQDAQHYRITLLGPLGLGSVRINGSPQHVTLQQGKQTLTANTPEALMQQQLGWHLPVSSLAYWLRGLPAPNSNHTQTDGQQQLTAIDHDNWQVKMDQYRCFSGLNMPSKLQLNAPDKQLSAMLVVTEWRYD